MRKEIYYIQRLFALKGLINDIASLFPKQIGRPTLAIQRRPPESLFSLASWRMKRLIFTVMVVGLLMACSNTDTMRKLQ